MKITKRQLRKIIKEEKAKLLEYEQYVDDEGNIYDDEGNVTRAGKRFGQEYGGETYGGTTASAGRADPKIAAVEGALAQKSDSFLESILSQLKDGRELSGKQKAIVRKIVMKYDPDAARLFERLLR